MAKKILCPVDFSKGSEEAIAKAEELALALGAELELFHAYQLPLVALPDSSVMLSPTFITDMTQRAERELERHRAEVAADGVVVSTQLSEGDASHAIVERARTTGAAMIVMGTHGRGGFRRFLLGSTAQRVLRTASVPVLTVHLPD